MKETKQSEFYKRKKDLENKDKENTQKYLLKQEQKEERMKIAKEDKEKENLSKYNKLYISATNQRTKYLREENVKEYIRSLKFQSMTRKSQELQEKVDKKNEENEERRRLEEEINKDRQVMMDRLQLILHSDGEYNKEEVNDYVFKGIKPKKKKKEEQNKNEENNDINNEKENNEDKNKENQDEYNDDNAFITGLPQ